MTNNLAQYFVWHLHRGKDRLGALGLLGVGLLLLTILSYLFWLLPLKNTLAQTTLTANSAQQVVYNPVQAQQLNLQRYLSALPNISQRNASVQSIMHLVAANNLVLDEVRYQSEIRQDSPIARYHMQFSVLASDQKVRELLSHILHEHDFVGIESLSLSRETVVDSMVEARVHLVMHFNAANASIEK
jgi:hypothetical protein